MHLKGFCDQQTKHAVLSISLLLKCHSLLHLLNMLMGEFGLQLLFILTLGDFFTSRKVRLASLCTYSAYLQHDSVPNNSQQSSVSLCIVL